MLSVFDVCRPVRATKKVHDRARTSSLGFIPFHKSPLVSKQTDHQPQEQLSLQFKFSGLIFHPEPKKTRLNDICLVVAHKAQI